MCTTRGKLTIGYQFYTAISSLVSAIFCAYAIGTNDLMDEYNRSQETVCKNIWYYLVSMTIVSGTIGAFMTGYLAYKCLCQMICDNQAELEFNCQRCICLGGYIAVNFWGYFVAIFTPFDCFLELKEVYPKVFGAFLLFNSVFTFNLIFVLLLLFNRFCRKSRDPSLLERMDSISSV